MVLGMFRGNLRCYLTFFFFLFFFLRCCGSCGRVLEELALQLDEGKDLAKSVEAIKDANKRGALHFAAREGQTAVCDYLLTDLKLSVDSQDDDGASLSLSLHSQEGLIFHFFLFYSVCLLSLYGDFRSVSTFKTFAAP